MQLKVIKFLVISFFVIFAVNFSSDAYADAASDAAYIRSLEDALEAVKSLPSPTPLAVASIKRTSSEVVTMKSGEIKDFEITLKNIGDIEAEKIEVTASLASVDSPISISIPTTSKTIKKVDGGKEAKITLVVKSEETAKAGTYTVNLNFRYRDEVNKVINDAEVQHIKIDSNKLEPDLILQNFATDVDKVDKGSKFILTADLKNIGDDAATDCQLLVEGLDSTKVYMAGTSNNLYFKTIQKASLEPISFTFHTNDDIKSGSYPLTFKLKYKNANNEATENTYTYYVNVSSVKDDESESILEMINIKEPDGVFEVAKEFKVTFDLANTGITSAKNIKITATTGDAGEIVPKSANIRTIPELKADQTESCTFAFAPTTKAKTQNYAISFKVEYENGLKTDEKPDIDSFEQYVGVDVSNPEADKEEEEKETKVSKPKIIIDSYTVEPRIVKAGQEFDLEMVFKNTHPTKSIENIKAVLSPNETSEDKGSVFMPVDGSNTFYITKIAPGATALQKFRMYAIPDADPRTYTITVHFKYQDGEYNEYEEEEMIGITVKQTTKLDTGNIMVPTEGFMFTPINVMFNLMNTGKTELNNLSCEIKGNFDTSKSFMYFGSLQKSGSSYYDAEIIPNAPGQQEGKIIISYEDDSGEVNTVEKPFSINVMESAPAPDMPMGMDGMNGGMGEPVKMSLKDQALVYAKKPLVWVGVGAFVVVAFIGKKIYDKKRRLKFDE